MSVYLIKTSQMPLMHAYHFISVASPLDLLKMKFSDGVKHADMFSNLETLTIICRSKDVQILSERLA